MSDLDAVLAHIDAELEASLDRLFTFLRIDSISTDPAYKDSTRAAADWLVGELTAIGFDAERHDTTGHPMVVGKGGDGPNHYMFYGHYDVQPVDPLDLWDSPPFEPRIEGTGADRVIRARGASDDKGQLMTFVEACRAWVAVTGALPTRLTMFFEGEEESGSPSLIPYLEAHRDALKADLALVCDTGMWDSKTPAITTSVRGMAAEEITITGPDKDLHSGMYGGPAINPIRVLTRILAGLHDDTGRITLPGFYDGVPEVPAPLKADWDSLGFDAAGFLGEVGLSEPAGETGFSVLEQLWARPTCEINGISGGYSGPGFKTVLPSKAMAKVSFRLVGDQDPEAITAALRKYIADNLPPDCTVSYKTKNSSKATTMPTGDTAFARARQALSDEWENPAVFVGGGGSIPVVEQFDKILGMNAMMVGFGLDDDAIHSPNEKYSLRGFHKGTRSWARILAALSAPE